MTMTDFSTKDFHRPGLCNIQYFI